MMENGGAPEDIAGDGSSNHRNELCFTSYCSQGRWVILIKEAGGDSTFQGEKDYGYSIRD